ncbi:hypothetical protein D0N36_06940 [Hymenobacter lapidiphilus]|uniref:hypothetical protein n=1 Tax=Hymenobacter sp. CCM 8763 TaxID=2303334 RepID=UPI000E340DC5|nr:hypothetical protein [Hymenobacter sp. CCM 8763]RFP65934.1 hypothetical protein D0N36_06940 [Hymenobacter sp. CCM 8763]
MSLFAAAVIALGCTYGPQDFREIILEPILDSPDLRSILTITDGVKAKKDVLFAERMRKVTKKDTGCGSTPTKPVLGIERVTWDPQPLEAWISECASDLEGSFMAWGLGVGYKRHDLQEAIIKIAKGYTETPEEQNYWNEFVQDTMEEAIRADIFRIGFFGNPTITAASLTVAGDVANYNQVLGLWPQIIAKGTADAKVRAYTIAANSATTVEGQKLAPGVSDEIFTALAIGGDRRLRSGKFGTPVIMATQSIIDNWAALRKTAQLETSFKLVETGLVGPTFDGIMVMPMPEWDEILNEDFNKNGVIDRPHRAVLTTITNLQLGFDSYDEATQLESWYEKKDKETHKRANYKMDAKVMRNFLTRAAY